MAVVLVGTGTSQSAGVHAPAVCLDALAVTLSGVGVARVGVGPATC